MGSMPGRDFREATRVVADLSGALLAWPELPQRDASSAMIGRTLGLLAQPCELATDGWRLAATRDSAQQRAARWWRTDLDDFEELTQNHEGTIKVALAGPWTLAAAVRLPYPTMNHVISDPGACRDIWQALAQGTADLAESLQRRFGRPVVVQRRTLIGAVLSGDLSTFSGLDRYRVPDREEVHGGWGRWSMPGTRSRVSNRCGCTVVRPGSTSACRQGWVRRAGLGHPLPGFGAGRRMPGLAGRRPHSPWECPHRPGGGAPVDRIVTDALQILRRLELPADLLDAQSGAHPRLWAGGWPMPDAAQLLQRLMAAAELVAERSSVDPD